MQIKTVQINIKDKMNLWLASINDEQLRIDVKKTLLVTGGSIVSLLTDQKVNDYDVYIKDVNVLKRLTQYYILPHQGAVLLDGREKEKLVQELQGRYAWMANAEEEVISAYAISLRNLKEDQIKLFLDNGAGGMRVNENKKIEDMVYEPMFFSPNAISLSNDVQIVIRFHGDNEAIHKTFDFVHATNYFTFETGLVTNKEALESIITKQLKYQGSYYPLTSVIRMKKFIKRDWNINAGEILKILFQVSELDLKNPDVLEEQLIGVDVAYFSKLVEILRGVAKESMTSQYLNAIIDRVFGESEETENE